jgi:glutathione S-transferase
MPEPVVFYTHPMSRGRIVRWLLEEIGEPYETKLLDYGTSMKAPDYLAVNPMGKVPAITHRGAAITECGAICTYLADAFPRAGLAPGLDDLTRGPYLRWMYFAAGPMDAAATNKALGFEPPAERKSLLGYGSLGDVLDTVEAALTHNAYLVGGKFSAADLFVASSLGWGMMFGTFEKRPVFEAYVQRLDARPAAIRANAIDDALLPPKT